MQAMKERDGAYSSEEGVQVDDALPCGERCGACLVR